ncbi:hypothetical protein R1sor_021151 [Riccia sorocarpa]|uniref:Uncharacterized protein n=1 Tax=Riccia sorocarpa TaxID=122646 RepID=A0ABD3GG85_9MARC
MFTTLREFFHRRSYWILYAELVSFSSSLCFLAGPLFKFVLELLIAGVCGPAEEDRSIVQCLQTLLHSVENNLAVKMESAFNDGQQSNAFGQEAFILDSQSQEHTALTSHAHEIPSAAAGSGKVAKSKLKWLDWQVVVLIEVKRTEHIEAEGREGTDRIEMRDAKWVKTSEMMSARSVEADGKQLKNKWISRP